MNVESKLLTFYVHVSSRYLGSTFLGHTTSADIFKALQKLHGRLDIVSSLVQLSMDGPNVNWCVHKEVVAHKASASPTSPKLLELGSCGLHVVHGAYKAGKF